MTEDVSASIRLSVTICLLATLMAAVVNLLIIGQTMLISFGVNYTYVATSIKTSAIAEVNAMPQVNGATLYRVLEEQRSTIASCSIKNKDGTIVTIEGLLENAHRNYKVNVDNNSGRGYKITATEVP